MNQVWTITKRELRAYFDSLTGYVIVTFFLLINGWFFGQSLFLNNQATLQTVFDLAPLILMFFVPAITMGSFAEERKTGTIELLLTLPLHDWQIVLAKVLSACLLVALSVGLTFVYALTIMALGDIDLGATFVGYVGLLLYGFSCVTLGVLASSFTKNQIIAFVLGFVLIFVLFMFDKSIAFFPAWMSIFLEYLGIDYHYQNMLRGVIDSRDIIYYFSLMVFAIFFTIKNVSKRV